MSKHNPLRDAVQLALTAGVATTVAAPVAVYAQDDDVAKQDKVTVTGSRIQRIDIEGPLPISTISRDDIDASGEISVAEVLRGSTFNSFGSFKPSSGSSAQSQATVSLRGLGAQRTLILLDGRRIAGSPTFGAGSAQNLNTIPLAAVERIEILRDGASAVYGSDAIGGVINVILRKDYEGVHLTAGIGRPTNDGGDEENFSITGGVSSGKGNITFALDHSEQEIIFNGDRDFSRIGLSSFGFPGSMFVDFGNGDARNRFADPRCPSGSDLDGDGRDDPNFSGEFPDSVHRDSRCRFNYAATSANEASIERQSFFVGANYEVSDNVNFFARGIFSKTESFGRYAPAPTTGFTMSQNNPNNPTAPGAVPLPAGYDTTQYGDLFPADATDFSRFDTDGDGTADVTGPFEITSIWYRNVPGGFRDSTVENGWVDGLIGLEGSNDWFGGADWEVGVQHSRQTNDDTSKGLGIATFTQSAIDSGAFDIFGVNGPTDPAVAATFGHSGFHNEETRIVVMDGSLSFDAFQMANGPVPLAVGFEYRDEKFDQDYDALQNAGIVFGSAGGDDLGGARAAYAVYAETSIPVLDNLDVELKVRRDHYNDFGNSTNPQISVGWRPLDTLLLRASWGQGFRAPSMSELYTSSSQSFNDGIDFVQCEQMAPGNVSRGSDGLLAIADEDLSETCITTQQENLRQGNTRLEAEESEQFAIGAVWNPIADLTLSFDYYDVEVENEITIFPINDVFNSEFAVVFEGSTDAADQQIASQVDRSSGRPVISLPNDNLEGVQTKGYDVGAAYAFSAGGLGDFDVNLQVSVVDEYLRRFSPTQPYRRLQQQFDPDLRGQIGLGWTRGNFGATAIGNHITDTSYSDNSANLSSWTTWDIQFNYATPWNGKVVAGARNVFDRDPPRDPTGLSNPYYSNQLHDVYGRVPYIRYEQDL